MAISIESELMTVAYIYCRSAVTDEAAIAAQETACRVYAEVNSLSVVGVFHDNGVSGVTASRSGLEALIEAVKGSDGPSVVLIDRSERLARNPLLFREVQTQLKNAGARLIVALAQAA